VRARCARLVCTLGPATDTRESVRALAEAGTDVFRLNASHGTAEDHSALVALVREIEAERERDLAVLLDLPGPKIRLGGLVDEPLWLDVGRRFRLSSEPVAGDAAGASTTYPGLPSDVRPGDRILLGDGVVELGVTAVGPGTVETEVARPGAIRSGAGVNIPAERLSLPAITDRDREALALALDLGVDLIGQSFVRSAADVGELRALMGERFVPIVAKIETRPAVDDIDAILRAADAIMVARGDLGVELPLEDIPILQKEMVRKARVEGVPAIVATQMLQSMVSAPRPTRAEVTDVANAVLDGADAIMLSGETAIGEYPVEAARVATRIAEVAEERAGAFRVAVETAGPADQAHAVAHAVVTAAAEFSDVVAIACFTRTGRTAALLSAERPSVPVIAFIPQQRVRRAMKIRWGVTPLPAEVPSDTDAMIGLMDDGVRRAGLVRSGEVVVMAASSPAGKARTNMMKVHRVGNPVR
jgi:pyruvate kinase